MASNLDLLSGGDAGGSKIRRNGNDEVPTDRNAVKIIRTVRIEEPASGSNSKSKTKPLCTKIAKLVYEPKTDPTKGVIKSIRSFKSVKPEVLKHNKKMAFKIKENNRNIVKKVSESASRKNEEAKMEYNLRKQERQIEVEEIKKMLDLINNFTDEMSKGMQLDRDNENVQNEEFKTVEIETFKSDEPVPMLTLTPRSKTEIDLPSAKSEFTHSLTKRSSKSRSKSSTTLNANEPVKRKKSYDPEIAKKFMEEQRKKRREIEKHVKVDKKSIDREEIKKRLEELRKIRLNILNNNLKRAKKKTKKPEVKPGNITHIVQENEAILEPTKGIKSVEFVEEDIKSISKVMPVNRSDFERPKECFSIELTLRDILKKTDNEELVIEQLKEDSIDKENISSNVLPLFNNSHKPQVADNQESNNRIGDELKSTEDKIERKSDNDSEESMLSVPKVALHTKLSLKEKSVQVDPPQPAKPPIPYWLKPTPVQLYPYNFIMAVRKKLEAIANPVLMVKKIECSKEDHIEATTRLTHLKHNRPKTIKKKLAGQLDLKERKIGKFKRQEEKLSSNSEGYTSFPSSSSRKNSNKLENKLKKKNSQKSSSAVVSNFSSISMHLPVSNTISEISSIRSEGHQSISARFNAKASKSKSVHHEDDTTMSSSVFSSPEKRPSKKKKPKAQESLKVRSDQDISPLSIENISKLQIKSKTILDCLTTTRGDNFNSPSIETIPIEKSKSIEEQRSSEKSAAISEFEQLLEDFNKSLTQVIEVNHQIKTALSNTSRLSDNEEKISPKTIPTMAPSVDSSKSRREEYSSDFEEAASTSDTKIKSIDNESEGRSGVFKNTTEEMEKPTNSKSNSNSLTNDIESNQEQESEFVPVAKKSSEGSISTQMSDFTTRQNEAKYNESQLNLKPIDSAKSVSLCRSFASEEFLDSIEEMSKVKNSTSVEKLNIPLEIPDDTINPKNISILDFPPKDYLHPVDEQYSEVNFFQGHVNVSRGDLTYYKSACNETSEKIPPAYSKLDPKSNNSSLGSNEVFAIFNKSVVSQAGSLSETTLNYSSLGLYEQLLQAENNKSDQLLMLLKMREKALIDRTKGQIAWLEVQKEKYKAKGLTLQISAIKKKQRAILLKMEREREEIKRMLQSKTDKKEKSKLIRPLFSSMSDMAIRKSTSMTSSSSRSTTIMKGQELQPNQSLEKILQKREEELKKRRAHVEHLIEWHKRLDKEEEEVLQMEQMLLDYNSQMKSSKILKKQKRIEDIDNSLKELQHISIGNENSEKNSYVRATGQKLNKLWKRLTGLKEQKFEPSVKYKLSKNDLEELYEEAKMTVLRDFGQEDEMKQLLDLSKFESTSNSNKSLDNTDKTSPQDNNINSGQSDVEKANLDFEKMNGVEAIEENEFLKEIDSVSHLISESAPNSPKDSFSNKDNNAIPNELSNEYIDTFEEIETGKETNSATIYENFLKSNLVEDLQNESGESSQPSDISIAKAESALQAKVKSSDSDMIDTVAEVASISCDSNNSVEDHFTLPVTTILQPLFQGENHVVYSDVESIHSLTVISKKQVPSEEEIEQRLSVIISRISVEATEEIDKENSSKELIETETPSTPANSEEHYSQSFISYESHQDLVISENVAAADIAHSNTCGLEITPLISDLTESVVDESSQEEKANNEQPEKSSAQESLDEILIEDMSLPNFEVTAEKSNSQVIEDISPSKSQQEDHSEIGICTTELEKRLIDLDVSLKELDETFERALSPEKSPSPSLSRSPSKCFGEDEKENMHGNQVALYNAKTNPKNAKSSSDNSTILMPDIINEVEIRRRQQIFLESDLKQLEHAVPYVFLREIPNKPPPPYVPPAHGSPMTTIFPPENRIYEITYRRVRELFEEMTKTEINNHLKRPSIMDENITNIYERIILDICKEMMQELQSTFNMPNPENYKNLLSLYNPPNRLKSLQDHIHKHVRKLLAIDKKNSRRNAITSIGHKKRDPVDEILIQELYEEEHKWTNFDTEEAEVKELIVEEIYNDLLKEALDEIIESYAEQDRNTVLEDSVDL